jgi:hypothetical protein
MNLEKILYFAIVFVCCSPTATPENGLTGKWKNGFMIQATQIDESGIITGIYDTIYDTTEIQFVGNVISVANSKKYKNHIDRSEDTTFSFTYALSNDTLNTVFKDGRKSYYRFAVANDSLKLTFMYGDTIKLNFVEIVEGKYKKE